MAAAVDKLGGIAHARRNCHVAPPLPPIPTPPVVVVPSPPVGAAPGAPPAGATAATVDATAATAASASPPSGEEPEGHLTSEACKADGNEHFKTGQYEQAVSLYTEAIGHDPTNAALLSNWCVLIVVAICHVFVGRGGWCRRAKEATCGGHMAVLAVWWWSNGAGECACAIERGFLLAGSAAWREGAWGYGRDESHRRA